MRLRDLVTAAALAVSMLLVPVGSSMAEGRFGNQGTQVAFLGNNVIVGADRALLGATRHTTKTKVRYKTKEKPGTIIVDTGERKLYLILGDGKALRYGVGVGRAGFEWTGRHRITRKAEWPGWRPPAAMRKRQPYLPVYMPGGPNNPLGARALYIGSTLYRIHGTNEASSIGRAMSSGCIRMLNTDVKDLYKRVKVGARVVVKH